MLKGKKLEQTADGSETPGQSQSPSQLFQEITSHRKENEDLRQQLKEALDNSGRLKGVASWFGRQVTSKRVLIIIGALTLFTLIILLIFISYQWHLTNITSEKLAALNKPESIVQGIPVKGDPNANGGGSLLKYYFNLGMTEDDELEECQGPELKHSFPDLDYALLGYNILKAYPLAVGHDPGFTYPIFTADYSAGKQTGDCRYSIPDGFVVVPDVSCVISFESMTVTTRYEFSNSLSVSASAKGGGWGVEFSASTEYKESSSVIASGEYVYILSRATCNYYFSKLVRTTPPKFDTAFLSWIYKLDRTDLKETYIQFFEIYGTHFATDMTFGSRFTYEHKMKTSSYESERDQNIDVAVSASYHGWFASGHVSTEVESSQRSMASRFSKLVTTKTITVGAAPPENGDAMAWASTVKEDPVPASYTLTSIEELFTEDFMKNLNINYRDIYKKIQTYKHEYCLYLKGKDQLDSCESLSPGIVLETTKLDWHHTSDAATFAECIEQCLEHIRCLAISFCKACRKGYMFYNTCFMFDNSTKPISAVTAPDWESIVFDTKIRTQLTVSNVTIVGIERGFENQTTTGNSLSQCRDLCNEDAHCVAYSYCTCPSKSKKCHLYSESRITRLKKETGTNSYFVSSRSSND